MGKKYIPNYRGSFSDRNGIDRVEDSIQITEFNEVTRNRLVTFAGTLINAIYIESGMPNDNGNRIMSELFSQPITCDNHFSRIEAERAVNDVILNDDPHRVLTTIEYLCTLFSEIERGRRASNPNNIFGVANHYFKEECIGYRFIDGKIAPITSETEIEMIEESLDIGVGQFPKNIEKSLKMLSDRENPDYENAVKEAVIGLENLVNVLIGETGKTLNAGIEIIRREKDLYPSYVKIVNDIYSFASSSPKIRHGSATEEHKLDFEEAKTILVMCCMVANYLISIYND